MFGLQERVQVYLQEHGGTQLLHQRGRSPGHIQGGGAENNFYITEVGVQGRIQGGGGDRKQLLH